MWRTIAVRAFVVIALLITVRAATRPQSVDAHRSGCHAQHSCPSDTDSYVCGDTGHYSQCPTLERDTPYRTEVRELQRRLNLWIASSGSSLKPLEVNGIFGNETEAAVRAWQTAMGRPVTGKVEPATLFQIGTIQAVPAPTPVGPFPTAPSPTFVPTATRLPTTSTAAPTFAPAPTSSTQVDCQLLEPPIRATISPSPCVAAGSQFTVRLAQMQPGLLVSVVLAGSNGLVSGADRAMRVAGDGELVFDTNDYFGARLTNGVYRATIRDFTGRYAPARADFVVGAPPVSGPTSPPIPAAPEPSATRQPTATVATPTSNPPGATAIPSSVPAPGTTDAEFAAYLRAKYAMLGNHRLTFEDVVITHAENNLFSYVSFDVGVDEASYLFNNITNATLEAWGRAVLQDIKVRWPEQGSVLGSLSWTYNTFTVFRDSDCVSQGDTLYSDGFLTTVYFVKFSGGGGSADIVKGCAVK